MLSKKHPLVSMITYCYDGERFVHKYFEAILAQTYDNIELIFFDNGSQDATSQVAQRYIPLLEKRGIAVQFIRYEENQCTCALKQEGFRRMHGDYFFGCDSDDLLHPDYIEKMVGYLLEHPDKGIVFCQLRTILETTGEQVGIMKIKPSLEPKGAFRNLLLAQNSIFTAISYMISKKHYLQVNPDMQIYISKFGENYQIQLPLLYADLQAYIEEPLGDYSVRYDSYTGKLKRDPFRQIRAYAGQEESITATLEQMKIPELETLYPLYRDRLRKEAFYASLLTKDRKTVNECGKRLKEARKLELREKLFYVLPIVYRIAMKIRRH